MSYDFNKVATPEQTSIEIYDANGKKAGLRIDILPTTAEKFLKEKRRAEDHYRSARGKKVSASKDRDIGERLFCARISGWEWHGPLKDAAEDFPFTLPKVREIMFGDSPFCAMVNQQVEEAMKDEANFSKQE